MFTGIIETTGRVEKIESQRTNKTFWIKSELFSELKIDQSLAHDGVCLTVDALENGLHRVTAIRETLEKSNISEWQEGRMVNLERSLLISSRLDGHFVQGHVDTTGTCLEVKNQNGSWEITFEFPKEFAYLIIEKGSICINGTSLTAFEVNNTSFKVAIIPYTWEHTNLQQLNKNDKVNLEFDIIGKYMHRRLNLLK